jgi:UDP-N-acetylmuramate--alanine ligase
MLYLLKVPGKHNVLNATAAVAVCTEMSERLPGLDNGQIQRVASRALGEYAGTRRRAEIVGEEAGILVIDDYGHHPTAIRTTLEGFRSFYPDRRIVLDFMSHTYSRTAALLDEFAGSFEAADLVILHGIYASAREKYTGTVNGKDLFRKARERHRWVLYTENIHGAASVYLQHACPGDLFITMGAGDNWKVGQDVLSRLRADKGLREKISLRRNPG